MSFMKANTQELTMETLLQALADSTAMAAKHEEALYAWLRKYPSTVNEDLKGNDFVVQIHPAELNRMMDQMPKEARLFHDPNPSGLGQLAGIKFQTTTGVQPGDLHIVCSLWLGLKLAETK